MSTPTTIHVALESGPLEPTHSAGPSGAEVVFLGRTRPEVHPEFGPLEALEYEAHDALALEAMATICNELARAFNLTRVSLRHAVGRVALGEASVEVVVASDHRAESFAACEKCMDQVKAMVPIWKRECFQVGSTWSDQATVLHEASP